jgi:hypothetical protein
MLTFLMSPLLPAYHTPVADAPENRRYTRLDHICSGLRGIQKPAQKSAPIPRVEPAFRRS